MVLLWTMSIVGWVGWDQVVRIVDRAETGIGVGHLRVARREKGVVASLIDDRGWSRGPNGPDGHLLLCVGRRELSSAKVVYLD